MLEIESDKLNEELRRKEQLLKYDSEREGDALELLITNIKTKIGLVNVFKEETSAWFIYEEITPYHQLASGASLIASSFSGLLKEFILILTASFSDELVHYSCEAFIASEVSRWVFLMLASLSSSFWG